jgi:competence protein ComEC
MKSKFIGVLFGLVYLLIMYGSWQRREMPLEVEFLDVGQGDAILITVNKRRRILIDGGSGIAVLGALGDNTMPWVRSLDVLVLTHPHSDHIQGLIEVMKRYTVKTIWAYPIDYYSPEYKYWQDLTDNLYKKGILDVQTVYVGDKIDIEGVELEILWPDVRRNNKQRDKMCGVMPCEESFDGNINNDSVVMLLSFYNLKILLMGDAEQEVEKLLIDKKSVDIHDVDVLKAGHHCSRTASSREFLEVVSPKVAICSCGKGNDFGHPHKEALINFEREEIIYLRTDEVGDIRVFSDGQVVKIKNSEGSYVLKRLKRR